MRSGKGRSNNGTLARLGAAALPLASTPAIAHAQALASGPLYVHRVPSFQGETLDQKVRMLVDREEIRDLIATYAHRAAHGHSMADLFTDDGAFINRGTPGSAPKEFRGRSALDKYFGGLASGSAHPLPMIHNQLVSVKGDEATGICSVENRITMNGLSIIASGYYRDKFRRENGWWRFTERDMSSFHSVPLQQGWAMPAPPSESR